MGLLQCPQPSHLVEENYSNSHVLQSGYSSSSSSSSSLQSIQSLPFLSSSQQLDPNPNTAVHHQCISTFKAHNSYVFSLVVSGKHLYSGSYDGGTRVWPRELINQHHQKLAEINSNGAVKCIVVLDDKLFTAHQDHKIRVWKVDSNNNEVHQMATLPTMSDRFLRLLSAKNYVQVTRHKSRTWVHHIDTVSSLAVSNDGSVLYSGSWDRTFKVWRTTDFKCLESVASAHDDAINALVLSRDGYVYTGSADKKIKVWKKHEGDKNHSLLETLQKHNSAVNALALSSDESVLYSGACDRSIIVWERENDGVRSGNMVAVGALKGHSKAILCLVVVEDLLCSGSADKTIRVWRKSSFDTSYDCLAVLEGHMKPVKCITAAVDFDSSSHSGTSYLIYSGSLDCDIRVWKIWVPSQ